MTASGNKNNEWEEHIKQCILHSGIKAKVESFEEFRRRQEGAEGNEGINGRLWTAINKINYRQALLLGGVYVLWPLIQFLFYWLEKKK